MGFVHVLLTQLEFPEEDDERVAYVKPAGVSTSANTMVIGIMILFKFAFKKRLVRRFLSIRHSR